MSELKTVRINTDNIDPDVKLTANWKRKGKKSWVGFILFDDWKGEQEKEIEQVRKEEEEAKRAQESSWYNPLSW